MTSLDPVTGAIRFERGELPRWLCGECGEITILCGCENVQHGKDFILKCLPVPDEGSTPIMLIHRFISIIILSPSMRGFSISRWISDHGGQRTILHAMTAGAGRLRELTRVYKEGLSDEQHYDLMVRHATVMIGPDLSATKKLERMRKLIDSTTSAFLAGDWASITFLGITLLSNSFPNATWENDTLMQTLFDTVSMVSAVIRMGFTGVPFGDLSIEFSPDGRTPARWHEWILLP